jgi:hypothetical protein
MLVFRKERKCLKTASQPILTDGYDVHSIIDIENGIHEFNTGGSSAGDWGYGYGYSVTDGVVILGKLRKE